MHIVVELNVLGRGFLSDGSRLEISLSIKARAPVSSNPSIVNALNLA